MGAENLAIRDLPDGSATGRELAQHIMAQRAMVKQTRAGRGMAKRMGARQSMTKRAQSDEDSDSRVVGEGNASKSTVSVASTITGSEIMKEDHIEADGIGACGSGERGSFPPAPLMVSPTVVECKNQERVAVGDPRREPADQVLWMQLCTDDARVPARSLFTTFHKRQRAELACLVARAVSLLDQTQAVLNELARKGGQHGLWEAAEKEECSIGEEPDSGE